MKASTDSTDKLIARLRKGDEKALSQVISALEDEADVSSALLEKIYPYTGQNYVIGITGAPGAGKSTLVDQLVKNLVAMGKKVGVIAVDPSSPFTGGAVLGDRIRMSQGPKLPGVFIRSMASRGALGGIAPHTAEAIHAFDAAGFDYVIVETVGVGQGELEIMKSAHVVVVVLVPGMGDGIQALKAGILEAADIFVINKADHEGADRLKRELLQSLSLSEKNTKKPEIFETVATEGKGITELIQGFSRFRDWAEESGVFKSRKDSFLREALIREIERELLRRALQSLEKSGNWEKKLTELLQRRIPPGTLALELVDTFLSKTKK